MGHNKVVAVRFGRKVIATNPVAKSRGCPHITALAIAFGKFLHAPFSLHHDAHVHASYLAFDPNKLGSRIPENGDHADTNLVAEVEQQASYTSSVWTLIRTNPSV